METLNPKSRNLELDGNVRVRSGVANRLISCDKLHAVQAVHLKFRDFGFAISVRPTSDSERRFIQYVDALFLAGAQGPVFPSRW
jgi:hypothetical protein